MSLIEKALQFATEKHDGQFDDEGKPYIMHPVAVASLLATIIEDDENLVAAAFLHDTLEDTDTTYDELAQVFNEDIANLVQEVTKLKVEGRKLFPMLHTRRGAVLKFADRLHNLSRLKVIPNTKWTQEKIDKYVESSRFWEVK